MTEAKTIPLYRPCHLVVAHEGRMQTGYHIHSDCGRYIMAEVKSKGLTRAGWVCVDKDKTPVMYWDAEAERQRDYINKRAKGNAWERANE